MYQARAIPLTKRGKKPTADFAVARQRLRSPGIDSEPNRSALDALARGLVSIGDRLRAPHATRVT